MDDQMNTLLNPPFAQNPPFNLDAKVLGIIIAVIAALGLLGSLLGIVGLLAIAAFGGILFIAIIGILIGGVAELLGVLGGWQMYQGNAAGKRLVVYGLIIAAAGEVVTAFGYLAVGNVIVPLIVIFGVYYLVVISRFPGEAPKTT